MKNKWLFYFGILFFIGQVSGVSIMNWKNDGAIGIVLKSNKACFYSKKNTAIDNINIWTNLSNGLKPEVEIWRSKGFEKGQSGSSIENCIIPSGNVKLEANVPYVIYMQDAHGTTGMHIEHFCIRQNAQEAFIAEISHKELGDGKVEFYCSDKPLKNELIPTEESKKQGFWGKLLMFLGIR